MISPRHLLFPLLSWLVFALAGCSSALLDVPGTGRVGEPQQDEGSELGLRIFAREADCQAHGIADPATCLPWFDRASGEVHLAFDFRLDGSPWPLPLSADQLRVEHQGSLVQAGLHQQRYELVAHDPRPSPQLFVLLIDGSGSMNQPEADPRIERVRRALLDPAVVSAFFPRDARTGVVLLRFVGERVEPVGGALEVVEQPGRYRELVRSIAAGQGYTHLYDALRYATGTLLTAEPAIRSFLRATQAEPTIIALTDGFNDQGPADRCRDNAPRLARLLEQLHRVRSESPGSRPRVFTVGLGRPFRPGFELPGDGRVTARSLCSKWADWPIDGVLEERGIDNASLAWIARVGGGESWTRGDTAGLGEAFRAAAARRYAWFEVYYRVDPFYLRRSFRTHLQLRAYARSGASLTFYPSAWLDGPPGERAGSWTRPRPLLSSLSLLLPLLGGLLGLGYAFPALHNARRALRGRLRPPAGGSGEGLARPRRKP